MKIGPTIFDISNRVGKSGKTQFPNGHPFLKKFYEIHKVQFISKCLFGAIVSTKKPTKNRSNQKNKGTLSY